MTPGDTVTLSKAAPPVTVVSIEGNRFSYCIVPGGREQWADFADALSVTAGPVGVAELKQRMEADGD